MTASDDSALAEAERTARLLALADKSGVEIRWLSCKPVGKASWECEWELSDGLRGFIHFVKLSTRREPDA
jgi:hypothetical protein